MSNENYPTGIGFIITKAPLESSLTYSFLTIAKNAIEQGKTISIFLLSDGIWLAKKTQKNNVVELFKTFLEKKVDITISKDHLEAAGIKDTDLLHGVIIAERPYADLVDFVMEKCRKVMIL
jgi:sulfur relay (sulfurtransferase) complex TusBCD TusD component (DsrE family)